MSFPIRALLRRLGQPAPRWRNEELVREFDHHQPALRALGLVRPLPPERYAYCPRCGALAPGRVRLRWDAASNTGAAEVGCPACGTSPVASEDLERWELDLQGFASRLAAAGRIRGLPTSFARGHGWHLGRACWAGRSHHAFLVRAVHPEVIPLLRERLDRFANSVVLTATPEDAHAWQPHGTQTVIELEDVLGFDGRLLLDVAAVEVRLRSDRPVRKPRSPKTRQVMAAKISRLVEELRTYVRESRDRGFATRDLSGRTAPLPRLTKSKLGELVGLKPYDVTRCFGHKDGDLLRLMWEKLDDPGWIMAR